MTVRVPNPSLRWLVAYLAAAVAGTVSATLGAYVATGAAPGIAGFFTRVLPFAAVALFVPVAVVSFLLMKANLWRLVGFAIAGAAIPVALFLFVAAVGQPGANFLGTLIAWAVSGALAGAVFHQVWERLS